MSEKRAETRRMTESRTASWRGALRKVHRVDLDVLALDRAVHQVDRDRVRVVRSRGRTTRRMRASSVDAKPASRAAWMSIQSDMKSMAKNARRFARFARRRCSRPQDSAVSARVYQDSAVSGCTICAALYQRDESSRCGSRRRSAAFTWVHTLRFYSTRRRGSRATPARAHTNAPAAFYIEFIAYRGGGAGGRERAHVNRGEGDPGSWKRRPHLRKY